MSELVTVKINGSLHKVPAGMNLIEATETVGVHIPNFCYLKGMKGIGACRMCVVEVNGKTMTACIMKTKEGMEIVTESERLSDMRKFVVDLILSMHPLDCMTCTKAGVCELQDYAYAFALKESNFTRKCFNFAIDEGNPFIKRDPDYCILCGRCVRVCKEQGTAVLDFMGRGVGSKVTTANDLPLQQSGCTFCGSCVDVCPVNAILEADRWRKGREWDYIRHKSVCLYCSNACDLDVSTLKGNIVMIRAGADDGRADYFTCATGRFGFDSLIADTRILLPMKRVNGSLVDTTWDDALQLAASKLKESSSGIVANGAITNEEAAALSALASGASVANVDTTVSLYGDEASLLGAAVDPEDADLFVVAGLAPNQWERNLPALDAFLRTKAERKAKLIVISTGDVKISDAADVVIKADEAEGLKALASALAAKGLSLPSGIDVAGASVTEEVDRAAELYKAAVNPVLLASPDLFAAAVSVAAIKGAALSIPIEANAKGVLLMGLTPKGQSYDSMLIGGVKVLFAAGELPTTKRPSVDFFILAATHMSDLARQADLLLPAAAYLEDSGSVVDYAGRLKKMAKAVEPPEDVRTMASIIGGIAKGCGLSGDTPDVEALYKANSKPAVPGAFKKQAMLKVDPVEMLKVLNTNVVNGSRLLWLQETEKALACAQV
ncbi:MAG: molybdopterin-dependent oxidoreductase [Magnetococcales bacterium]|nr:molybdopterin-dependent oxidoreductase [Nitrospirota bacterium]